MAGATRPREHPAEPASTPRSSARRARPRRPTLRIRRRRATAAAVYAAVAVLGATAIALSGGSSPRGSGAPSGHRTPAPPSTPLRARIVAVAESQLGYRTSPAHSYCNKYSAYWGAGARCAHGLRREEWCADFAAWVWRKAGAQFTYSYGDTDLNASAASFYRWATAHGTWHPAGSGYVPKPGDVAVYGLETTAGTAASTAAHVAVVTGFKKGERGPDVVNGDGDHTGFSVVESGADQYRSDGPGAGAPLSGYAAPIPPRAHERS